jgi:prolyl oligopeptidase PreP (S9A serine peptidase family)
VKFFERVFTLFFLQKNPLMIRLDTKAGHGAGKPTSKSIEEYTDIFCFLIRALGIQYRQEEGEFLLLLSSDPSR